MTSSRHQEWVHKVFEKEKNNNEGGGLFEGLNSKSHSSKLESRHPELIELKDNECSEAEAS